MRRDPSVWSQGENVDCCLQGQLCVIYQPAPRATWSTAASTAQGLDHTNPKHRGCQTRGAPGISPLACWFSRCSLSALSHFSRVQLCVIPRPAAHQALLSLGFCRQEHWSGLLCPSPVDMLNPGLERLSLTSNLHRQQGSLLLGLPGKPQYTVYDTVTTSCWSKPRRSSILLPGALVCSEDQC